MFLRESQPSFAQGNSGRSTTRVPLRWLASGESEGGRTQMQRKDLEKLGHLLEEIWHPDDGELLAYVLEEVADEEREGLTQHLATCKACARELEEIRELASNQGLGATR